MNKEIEELLNKIKQQLIIDEKLGKEIAKDFHKTILNYEETKLLLSYIEQLQQENEQLKKQKEELKDILKIKLARYRNEEDYYLTIEDFEDLLRMLGEKDVED